MFLEYIKTTFAKQISKEVQFLERTKWNNEVGIAPTCYDINQYFDMLEELEQECVCAEPDDELLDNIHTLVTSMYILKQETEHTKELDEWTKRIKNSKLMPYYIREYPKYSSRKRQTTGNQ